MLCFMIRMIAVVLISNSLGTAMHTVDPTDPKRTSVFLGHMKQVALQLFICLCTKLLLIVVYIYQTCLGSVDRARHSPNLHSRRPPAPSRCQHPLYPTPAYATMAEPAPEAGDDLHAAIKAGDADAVAALIGGSADVEARDKYENTPLMLASNNGFPAIVTALIAAGADVNATDAKGKTALLAVAGVKAKARTVGRSHVSSALPAGR